MPVKKTSSSISPKSSRVKSVKSSPVDDIPSVNASSCDCPPCDCSCSSWSGSFGHKLLLTFLGILLVYVIVYLGTLIRNELKEYEYIGMTDKSERMITVDAVGKVSVKPDIAMTVMGVVNNAVTVEEAQSKNTDMMNTLVARVKEMGVSSDDIQTSNYTINPIYDYTEAEGRQLRGYEVSQNVTVKIRDLTKSSQILGLAGEVGANNVGGLQFTVDERDVYITQAREDALEKIGEKIKMLKSSLGVRFVEVVSYGEYEMNGGNYGMYKMYAAEGMGGLESAPQVEPGTNEVSLQVSVTFEIK